MNQSDRLDLEGQVQPFSGSYQEEECLFLLRRLSLAATPLRQREQRMAEGVHYSEMIGPEDRPSRERMALFSRCLRLSGERLARDLAVLARRLLDTIKSSGVGELTLVSIARAGTPIGVVLYHLLRRVAPDLSVRHYALSVIRDRGIDLAALDWILRRHPAESVRFVDGWTGKGTIATEIRRSLSAAAVPAALDVGLWVPLDVCGAAGFAASADDYLIPSTLLGGTISGLVSRSVLPRDEVGKGLMHGCVVLPHLRKYDVSRWFVRHMMEKLSVLPFPDIAANASGGGAAWERTQGMLAALEEEFSLTDRNKIKLGIGETVRVLLRRLPRLVLLREPDSADGALIQELAAHRQVPVSHRPALPFAAVALIQG